MAARARGRPSQNKDDASEERHLWQQIYEAMKSADEKLEKRNANHERVIELQKLISTIEASGEQFPIEAGKELDKLLRENISLTEDITGDIGTADEDSPHGSSSITQQLEILIALRGETDNNIPPTTSRASSTVKASRNPKRAKLDVPADNDRDSIAADSPGGPSPKISVSTGAASRLLKQGGASRSGSVPAVREPSVKTEDGETDVLKATTPTPSTSTVGSGSASAPSSATTGPGERVKLVQGAEVFYRNTPRPTPRGKPAAIAPPLELPEGEGILCSVTAVIGEGKQRRYEIRDIDDSGPTPPAPYRASVSALVPIPPMEQNERLPSLSAGKQVLALYPGTTTFYKAEVVTPKDTKKGWVRLRFEGEDEIEKEQEVERRYVLPDSVK